MCGWGAGGREWAGQGVAWGAGELRRHVGGINSRGRMSGENTGRPGRVPLVLPGGAGGTGQQPQIQPERLPNEGVLTSEGTK